jgi:hypothetical protein
MPKPGNFGEAALAVLSSSRLALVLVLLLILLALAGAVLPQEGKVEPSDILRWQEGHPGISALVRPLGLFRVFHSAPFLVNIVLLALNTLTCTLRRLLQPKSRLMWRNLKDIRAAGFLGLHISLLLLMGGGFHSSATRMDGYFVLTEGQSIEEDAGSYVTLAEGPLRKKKHQGFQIGLGEVAASYDSGGRLAESVAKLKFQSREGQTQIGTARANHPVSFLDVAFTLDETGFSPRLTVRKQGNESPLVDTFVALKTFREGRERDYRDFLNLPFLNDKIFVRFLPDSKWDEGGPVKSGDKPGNSLLHLWTENEGGEILEQCFVPPGGTAGLAGYDFAFVEFRRWAGFRVVQDSGYIWVLAALWLGLGSLLLRYIPELKGWFSPRADGNDATGGQQDNGTS